MQGIVLDNDVFVIEHTLPPHNDVFTAPAAFFHYEGWGVFKLKETLAASAPHCGRSRPLFALRIAVLENGIYSVDSGEYIPIHIN